MREEGAVERRTPFIWSCAKAPSRPETINAVCLQGKIREL